MRLRAHVNYNTTWNVFIINQSRIVLVVVGWAVAAPGAYDAILQVKLVQVAELERRESKEEEG